MQEKDTIDKVYFWDIPKMPVKTDPDWRSIAEDLNASLLEVVKACRLEPAMQDKKYDLIGIRAFDALSRYGRVVR